MTKRIIANTRSSLRPAVNRPNRNVWNQLVMSFFLSKQAWDAIRKVHPKVPCCKVVWLSQYVIRWTFMQWLCFLSRLATTDWMMEWGTNVESSCVLRGQEDESLNHLCSGYVSLVGWLWNGE